MLKIERLNKRFANFTAVSDLDLEVQTGELFGFVGHNGAGKTTTLKNIAGLLKPTSGHVTIDGSDLEHGKTSYLRKIGYVPDFFGVYDNLKVLEYMEFFASMYGLTGKESRMRCLELLELAKLENRPDTYVDTLSRGMKQKLCIVRSLIHDPDLLLLDEPASGLDPGARYDLKALLKHLHEEGKTILISSHILPELSDMCTSIGIMRGGHLLLQGSMEEIELQARYDRPLKIRVLAGLEKVRALLREDPQCTEISWKGNEGTIRYRGNSQDAAGLLEKIISSGAMLESFYREKGSLEALFIDLTKEEDNGQPERGNHP